MRTIKTAFLLSGFVGLSAALVSGAAISATGKGWDTFDMGLGEPIPVVAKAADTPSKGAPGKGWDFLHMGAGEPMPAYSKDSRGESTRVSAGKGWDMFDMGLGEAIHASQQPVL